MTRLAILSRVVLLTRLQHGDKSEKGNIVPNKQCIYSFQIPLCRHSFSALASHPTLKFVYIFEQKIPSQPSQHCQRSQRAASLFLPSTSRPWAGDGVKVQCYLCGRCFWRARVHPRVPVVIFLYTTISIEYIRLYTVTDGGGSGALGKGCIFWFREMCAYRMEEPSLREWIHKCRERG